MGSRGPAPLPTPIKRMRGETRKERLNDNAPRPIRMLPTAPADLGTRAREVWDRQIASMGATGVLTPVDGDALRAYCEAVERYEEAARLLRGSGPLVRGARSGGCSTCGHGQDQHRGGKTCRTAGCSCQALTGGEWVRNPLHQIARDNAMLIRLFARDLGFVPSGREGLHPGGIEEEEDAFDAWLGAGAK